MKRFITCLIIAVILTIAVPAFATTWTVNSTSDTDTGSGDSGTLRYCLLNAGSGDTIQVSSALSGTITLGSALPTITVSLTINLATGLGPLILNGSGFTGSGVVSSGFYIDETGITVNITGATFTNGSGAVACRVDAGTLNISKCTFSNNSNTGGGGGGVLILNSSFLNITDCTFYDNTSEYGGAVYAAAGTTTCTNCTCSDNTSTYDSGGFVVIANTSTSFTATNCIGWGDNSGDGEIGIGSGSPTIRVTYSCIQNGYSGTGNISTNPNLGSLASNGGPTQTMAITSSSTAYKTGTATGAPATDQRGKTFTNPPSMGAYGPYFYGQYWPL